MNKTLKNAIGFTALGLYIIALFTECYSVDGSDGIGTFGFIALLLGWLNFDTIGIIWLANPLFAISLLIYFIAKKPYVIGIILSTIAFGLALSFRSIEEIIKDEAGHMGQITELSAGYWMWVTALLLLSVGHLLKKVLQYFPHSKNA